MDAEERNIRAVLEHSNETRRLLRASEEKVQYLENLVLNQNSKLDILQGHVNTLLAINFSGAATDNGG